MLIDYADIKFIHDNAGDAQEVIIGYDLFQEIEAFLSRHAYFYSEVVQNQLKKSNDDMDNERYVEVTSDNIEDAIAWLHE